MNGRASRKSALTSSVRTYKRVRVAKSMKILNDGDRVRLINEHPWRGHVGRLLSHETYGLGWTGWRIKLDNTIECYAQERDVYKI